MWFDILKVLGTKSGYAQLDFDNIVEEEETNCKKRFQEICNVIERFTKQEFKINNFGKEILELKRDITGNYTSLDEPEGKGMRKVDVIFTAHEYDPTIPEEIYCKALEVFDEVWASEAKYDAESPPTIDINDIYYLREYNYDNMKGVRIFEGLKGKAAIYFATSFGDNSKIILNNEEFTKEELFEKVKGILP